MPVTWDFYIKRKRINLDKWFDYHQIVDYSSFLNVLDVNDVMPPSEEEISKHFISLKKKSAESNKSSGMVVDEKGFLVAKQAKVEKKKPVRKRRTSRAAKKTTTKSR